MKNLFMKNLFVVALLSLAATMIAKAEATVTITPTKGGLQIKGDSEYLKFTLGYPVLISSDKKKTYKNGGVEVKDNTAVLKYNGGGELTIAIDPSGTITLTGNNLPADVGYVEMRMVIAQSFKVGGTYQLGANAAKPFPEIKPDKPQLFQGDEAILIIRAGDKKGLIFTIPPYSYQEVTDFREWNTQSFGWMSQAKYTPGASLTYKIEDAGPGPAAAADGAATPAPAAQ